MKLIAYKTYLPKSLAKLNTGLAFRH